MPAPSEGKGSVHRDHSNVSHGSHGSHKHGSRKSSAASIRSRKSGKATPEPTKTQPPPREHTLDLTENEKIAKDVEEKEKQRTESPDNDDNKSGIPEQKRHEEPENENNHEAANEHSNEDIQEGEEENDNKEPAFQPEDFDPKSFLARVDELSAKLHEPEFRTLEGIDEKELNHMVKEVTTTMNQFQVYSDFAHGHLEKLRDQLKDVKDRMYKRINQRAYDQHNASQRMSLEEREQEAKVAALNQVIAKAAEELVRASSVSAETEAGALTAALAATQAAEEAKVIQAEYEARRKAEQEARRREEEKRAEAEKKRLEEEKRQEEARKAEEQRRSRLKPGGKEENKPQEWENWPLIEYDKEIAGEFDGGMSCIVRGNPQSFNQGDITVRPISPMQLSEKPCKQNEELVGNIIAIETANENGKLEHPVQLLLPHCTSRASAMSREPVVKAQLHGQETWTEFKSHEVALDGHKDVKFVQAEISESGNYAVVTKMKQDYLQLGKKRGRVVSAVDSRITFEVESGTFEAKENYVMQLQPVDSNTTSDIRRTEDGKGLLTSSSVVELEFTSKEFGKPIQMTLPCPANPIKAKKAAAARAAKLEKMKKPAPNPIDVEEEKQRKREAERKRKEEERLAAIASAEGNENAKPKQKNKWYMGEYGNNDEDESELVYFLSQTPGGHWKVLEHMAIIQPRIDLLQFALNKPIRKFVVIRTKTDVDIDGAQKIAALIEKHLLERFVTVILKQRSDSGVECCLNVCPVSKKEKVLKQLEDDGYDDGPGASSDLIMREGDLLEISFRGNIQNAHQETKLEMVFNSQLPTSCYFEIEEVNKFLQRNYPSYRGFVLLNKKTPIKTQKKDGEEEDERPIEYEREVLCEHLVTVPKEMEMQQTITRAPVIISNQDDPVTDDTLRHLAVELGDEWLKVAHHLNVKRMRIQAIQRNNINNSEEDMKYDMLLSWIKRVPRSANKTDVLCSALHLANRTDLAQELRDIAENWKHQKTHSSSRPASRTGSKTGSRPGSRTSNR